MKRIGIISFYYKNHNYGGLLQAYALEKFINRNWSGECIAEQISFDKDIVPLSKFDRVLRFICRGNLLEKILGKKSKNGSKSRTEEEKLNRTHKAMDRFAYESIAHSEKVYDENTFSNADTEYDMFICGSDQVWNPLAVRKAYLLIGLSKKKVSYAASIAAGELKRIEQITYKKALRSFDFLSVREKSSAEQLKKILRREIDVVLDPTLLLQPQEWQMIAKKPEFDGKYVFAYFLSEPSEKIKRCIEDCREKGFSVVTIAGLNTRNGTQDIEIENCGPLEFLGLILNAEKVFTDSFHAMVFSVQFRTPFLISNRQHSKVDMSERIYSFVHLIGFENVVVKNVSDNNVLEYVYNFDQAHLAIDAERQKSIDFLSAAISKVM